MNQLEDPALQIFVSSTNVFHMRIPFVGWELLDEGDEYFLRFLSRWVHGGSPCRARLYKTMRIPRTICLREKQESREARRHLLAVPEQAAKPCASISPLFVSSCARNP